MVANPSPMPSGPSDANLTAMDSCLMATTPQMVSAGRGNCRPITPLYLHDRHYIAMPKIAPQCRMARVDEPKDHTMPRASQQTADSDVAMFLTEVSRILAGPEFYEPVDYNDELRQYSKRVLKQFAL